MSVGRPLLEVERLRVEFQTRRGTQVAVDEVSFGIDAGEILGVDRKSTRLNSSHT